MSLFSRKLEVAPSTITLPKGVGLASVKRWIFPALLLTFTLQLILFGLLHVIHVSTWSAAVKEKELPRAFHMKQVHIDPRLLDSPGTQRLNKELTSPDATVAAIQIPGEKPSYEQELANANIAIEAPKISDETMAISEKPKVESSEVALPLDDSSTRDQLLNTKPSMTNAQAAFSKLGNQQESQANTGPDVGLPNFSNLDNLLSKQGPLSGREGPILLPTDLLFDYDSANLRLDAEESLSKLGQLITKNPQANFMIDGHTDLFGTPEYNQDLSQRRADSVKAWLIQHANVDPTKVTTRGFGSRHPLVKKGTVAEQQLNRRVEIVIRTKRE